MFGKRVKFCLTYKTGQAGFDIYRRKYQHNFKVNVQNDNYEGSLGLELQSMNTFLVTKRDSIQLYDNKTFQMFGQLPIILFKSDTREIT